MWFYQKFFQISYFSKYNSREFSEKTESKEVNCIGEAARILYAGFIILGG